jgi:stage V sporulation protein G
VINITEVRVSHRHNEEEKLKAFASITIDNSFVVRGLKIIMRGSGKLFVAMPSRLTRSGESQDVCHPINQETRDLVERLVLAKYEEESRLRATSQAVATESSHAPSLGEREGSPNNSPNSVISTRRD